LFIEWLDRKLYPGIGGNWDDQLFRDVIIEHVMPYHRILDLGAGAGIVPHMNFQGHVKYICGIDPDERVTDNQYLDEGKVAVAENIPYPDETFDLVFSDNVLEHLENPHEVFIDVCRVLKPGGIFLVKTPNKYHYMPLVARLTPHWFHRAFNRRRGRDFEDIFPTLYLANTVKEFEALAESAELVLQSAQLVEGRPEYLRISSITYLFGWCYERLVNRFAMLARFRILLVGEFRKPVKSI